MVEPDTRLLTEKEPHRTIAPILEMLKADSRTLPIWGWDGGLALYYLVVALEYDLQRRLLAAQRAHDGGALANLGAVAGSLTKGLNAAVHEVYRLHPDLQLVCPPDPLDWEAMEEAVRTLVYSFQCATAFDALYDARYGTREPRIVGSSVYLPFTTEGVIDHEAWKTAHGGILDPNRPNGIVLLDVLVSPEVARLWEMMRSQTWIIGKTDIMYRVQPAVKLVFAELAARAVATVDLPTSIRVGGYSLEEFRHFNRWLYECAATRLAFCYRAIATGANVASGLIMRLKLDDLYADLSNSGELSQEVVERIVSDLTYDIHQPWTNVLYQPLFPIAPGEFLVSPTLVTSSIWENNLANMWAKKHSAEYSQVVGDDKKQSAEDIAKALRSHGFMAVANREYYLTKGQVLGDVDVAAFDPDSQILFLAEVKWLLPPPSSREARARDRVLRKGIDQVRSAAAFVKEHPEKAAEQLFGSWNVQFTPATRVLPFLIARGHLGSFNPASQDVEVLDFHRTLDTLRETRAKRGLGTVVDELKAVMHEWISPIGYEQIELQFALAGLNFRIPAFRFVLPQPPLEPPLA